MNHPWINVSICGSKKWHHILPVLLPVCLWLICMCVFALCSSPWWFPPHRSTPPGSWLKIETCGRMWRSATQQHWPPLVTSWHYNLLPAFWEKKPSREKCKLAFNLFTINSVFIDFHDYYMKTKISISKLWVFCVTILMIAWWPPGGSGSSLVCKMCLEKENSVCWHQVTVGLVLHNCTKGLSCAIAYFFCGCKCEQKSWVGWCIPLQQLNEWVCSDKVWKDIFPKWYAHNTLTVQFCNGHCYVA